MLTFNILLFKGFLNTQRDLISFLVLLWCHKTKSFIHSSAVLSIIPVTNWNNYQPEYKKQCGSHWTSYYRPEKKAKFWLKSSTLYSQCQRNRTQTGQEIDPHILHVLDDKVSCRLVVNHWDSHTLASGKWNRSFKSKLALYFQTAVNALLLFGLCFFSWRSCRSSV